VFVIGHGHGHGHEFFSAVSEGCSPHPASPTTSAAPVDTTVCEPGMLPDAGVCVATDPACPPAMHLEFGRGCVRDDAPVASNSASPTPPPVIPDVVIEDLVPGTGAPAEAGRTIVVHYTGKLATGEVFDSSIARGQPFTVKIGQGMLIKGWEEGMMGMRVGGTRKLTIAPAKGYGARGAPPKIPPNAVLVFTIELIDVR
jgi:hypothetical protein